MKGVAATVSTRYHKRINLFGSGRCRMLARIVRVTFSVPSPWGQVAHEVVVAVRPPRGRQFSSFQHCRCYRMVRFPARYSEGEDIPREYVRCGRKLMELLPPTSAGEFGAPPHDFEAAERTRAAVVVAAGGTNLYRQRTAPVSL